MFSVFSKNFPEVDHDLLFDEFIPEPKSSI